MYLLTSLYKTMELEAGRAPGPNRCRGKGFLLASRNISGMAGDREQIRPYAAWSGRDRIDKETVGTVTVIFRTRGCSYGKCRMCAYRHVRDHYPDEASRLQDLSAQLRYFLTNYPVETASLVKIYTSGSFFDPVEVPEEFRVQVARSLGGKHLVIETRPEYVTVDGISAMLAEGGEGTKLSVAIGVETSSDRIRDRCIRKGFTFRDFTEACRRAGAAGATVKAYLLHKPPFLTEQEALADMHSSIRDLQPLAATISMNPCTVQRHTTVERLWMHGAYRPPYLWSVAAALLAAPVPILCDPVGGGRSRGPHNCGECDRDILSAIREFSLTGEPGPLRDRMDEGCRCQEEWKYVLSSETAYAMPLTR